MKITEKLNGVPMHPNYRDGFRPEVYVNQSLVAWRDTTPQNRVVANTNLVQRSLIIGDGGGKITMKAMSKTCPEVGDIVLMAYTSMQESLTFNKETGEWELQSPYPVILEVIESNPPTQSSKGWWFSTVVVNDPRQYMHSKPPRSWAN
jgi:hypothetical protein